MKRFSFDVNLLIKRCFIWQLHALWSWSMSSGYENMRRKIIKVADHFAKGFLGLPDDCLPTRFSNTKWQSFTTTSPLSGRNLRKRREKHFCSVDFSRQWGWIDLIVSSLSPRWHNYSRRSTERILIIYMCLDNPPCDINAIDKVALVTNTQHIAADGGLIETLWCWCVWKPIVLITFVWLINTVVQVWSSSRLL